MITRALSILFHSRGIKGALIRVETQGPLWLSPTAGASYNNKPTHEQQILIKPTHKRIPVKSNVWGSDKSLV